MIALVIRGGAFAVIQDMLNGGSSKASESYQQLVLRMLGLDPQESAEVVSRAKQKLTAEATA
jgi:hypothetical protein